MTDAERAAASEAKIAIGMLESILLKVQKELASDKPKNWETVLDLKHLTAQLHAIEDQVSQSGEYART